MGHKLTRLGGRTGRPTRGEARSERSKANFVPRSAGAAAAPVETAPVATKKTQKRTKKK